MNMMKKAALVCMVILLTLSSVACGKAKTGEKADGGSSENAGDSASSGNGEKRKITWMNWRGDWASMEAVAADYMKENPDVEIVFEAITDPTAYYQQIQILAASNELPELFESDANTILKEIAAKGTLVDIDELLEELEYDRMTDLGLNYARLDDGHLYSLDWESNIEVFWYHKDLFAQAGIEKAPETFDEFLEVCQQLKDTGITPISTFPGWGAMRYLSFIPYRLTGNDFIESVKVGEAKMSDPVGIQAAQFFQKLGTEYFQPGWSSTDITNARDLFLSKNAAIYHTGSWEFGSFLDEETRELKEDYDFFLLPTMDGAVTGQNTMVAHAGIGTSINKDKFDDQVKDFLTYVLDVYPEKAFYEFNVVPCMAFDTTQGTFSSFDQRVYDIAENMDDFAYTWDVRLDMASGEELGKEMVNLGIGSITPEEFAERMDNAIATNIAQ